MRKLRSIAAAVSSILLLLTSFGCASNKESSGAPGENLLGGEERSQSPPSAISYVNPARKHKANGIFTFTPVPQGLRIIGGLTGLSPGIHALHLHEGDCPPTDAFPAGNRQQPAGPANIATNFSLHHVGDLGNFAVDANGDAKIDFTNSVLTLTGNHSILGRSLIVYEGSDNSTNHLGQRVACGVIQMKPAKP